MKEQLVHGPEPVLACGRLGCRRCGEGVRVDLGQREVAEGEANAGGQSLFDAFDLSKGPARVRAFVVAVLDDQATGGRATDVIDPLVKRLHGHAVGFSRTRATPWPDPTQTPRTPYLASRRRSSVASVST